jgi:hypothetical protein
MNHRYAILLIMIECALVVTVRAQVTEDDRQRIKADSIKHDYEEWLRNEPLKDDIQRDSMGVKPEAPSQCIVNPEQLLPTHKPVNIPIMTPRLKTDMRLAYQSHFLQEQQKAQQGGAMTIGVSPLAFIGYLVHKIFPQRKSKKQRQREQLQQILDNY